MDDTRREPADADDDDDSLETPRRRFGHGVMGSAARRRLKSLSFNRIFPRLKLSSISTKSSLNAHRLPHHLLFLCWSRISLHLLPIQYARNYHAYSQQEDSSLDPLQQQ